MYYISILSNMFTLATDVQKIIMEFLHPEEIKAIYETCKDAKIMFDELTKHTNLIIKCKRYLKDIELKWFELKNIKLKLLEIYKNDRGTQYWYKNGKYHRDNDLPALILANGDQYWCKDGKQHRDNNDLPAVICVNGSQHWYKNGNRHRDNDLPSMIYSNGRQHWYKNGLKHRDNDLPAVIYSNGEQHWYKNDVKYIPKKLS
jgi:hypothetical protein